MTTFQEATFEAVRTALAGQVICSRIHRHSTYAGEDCNLIADPIYADLLALFKEPCPHVWDKVSPSIRCAKCIPTGFTSRYPYWQAAPDGALEGALIKALIQFGVKPTDDILDLLIGYLLEAKDTSEATLTSFPKWLKEAHDAN